MQVAIVGSREAGKLTVDDLVQRIPLNCTRLISGGASGVDQLARQAAQALEVSQALLSHYENGIREPGLAFVVRACDYYQVSADYLLGRRVEREGGRAQGAPEGVDPAVLRSAAEVLTQLCLELCRRHPESQALFHCLAGELAQEMPAEKKPTTREKKPKAVKA